MKVLCFGSINIDYVYSLPHIILPGETLSSTNFEHFAGGKGANQSVALSKAGLNVYHAGKLGKDGKWIIDKLESFNVNCSLIEILDEPSGHTIIQISEDGENSIILSPGTNYKITKEYIDLVLSKFSKNDLIVLQNEINNIDYIINRAWELGLKICLNPAPMDENIFKLNLKRISYLILNELEGSALAGKRDDPMEIINYLGNITPKTEIILTLGKDGSIVKSGLQIIREPALSVKAIDTTAAGDTFTGYYLKNRCSGNSIRESIKNSSLASSITVQRKGAMDSIPYLHELTDLFESSYKY